MTQFTINLRSAFVGLAIATAFAACSSGGTTTSPSPAPAPAPVAGQQAAPVAGQQAAPVGTTAAGQPAAPAAGTVAAANPGAATTRPAVSSAFANNCASCHGTNGAGGRSAPVVLLNNTAINFASFQYYVNNGVGGMPAFQGSTTYTAADLQSDWHALTGL